MTKKEYIKKRREEYPKSCAMCGGPLNGPGTDQELEEMFEEHNKLFPDTSITTAEVICDTCFQRICPGGKTIGMN